MLQVGKDWSLSLNEIKSTLFQHHDASEYASVVGVRTKCTFKMFKLKMILHIWHTSAINYEQLFEFLVIQAYVPSK